MWGTSRSLTYAYDLEGNRTKVTHPGNVYFTYGRDGLNRMCSIGENGAAPDCLTTNLATDPIATLLVHYSPEGRRADITRAGGSVTNVQTDNALHMLSFTQHFPVAGNDLTNTFGYNNASQITSLTQSNTQYNYAEAQNRTGAYVPNGLNQYTQIDGMSVTYDAKGKLTADGAGMTFTYDMENHLVATGGSTASTLSYDVLGRLSQLVVGGHTTQFLYDGDALVDEYYDGVHNRRYVHGDQVDEPLIQYNGSSVGAAYRRYLHADHQGSIIAHSDNTGAVIAQLAYDPYGIPALANSNRFGYTGQMWLQAVGLDYYKPRIYAPKLGRFLQGDPIFYKDDFNLYAYVGNDPMNSADPEGKRDIFIGGMADKNWTRIVQDYQESQAGLHPDRDVQYFSYSEKKEIATAINAPRKEGEPLNVIGHSLGGREAIRQANSTDAKITNLITIDPVGSAGDGRKPSNVQSWTNVQAAPSDRNQSYTVASVGRFLFGTTQTSGADSNQTVKDSHGDFPSMMSESGSQKKVDASYPDPKVVP